MLVARRKAWAETQFWGFLKHSSMRRAASSCLRESCTEITDSNFLFWLYPFITCPALSNECRYFFSHSFPLQHQCLLLKLFLFLEKRFSKRFPTMVSVGNCITLSPVTGWLCQERGKTAGTNKAVHSAAFGINKSLLLSCSSLQQKRGAERNERRGVRRFSRVLLGKEGKCKVK